MSTGFYSLYILNDNFQARFLLHFAPNYQLSNNSSHIKLSFELLGLLE